MDEINLWSKWIKWNKSLSKWNEWKIWIPRNQLNKSRLRWMRNEDQMDPIYGLKRTAYCYLDST